MCSQTASPRVSFSNDLLGPSQEQSPMDQKGSRRDDKLILDSSTHHHPIPSPDFEFRFCEGDLVLESSSADELFSNGIILPFISREVPRSDAEQPCPSDVIPRWNSEPPPVSSSGESPQSKKPETTTQKSFWGGFKRSASLNSEKKKGLIFHLPLLSRSNSTGSVAPNQKPKPGRQVIQKQSSSSRSYQFPQKPPLRKNSNNNNVHGAVCYGNGNANGIRVSPVLNVSPNLLGFGSFLRHNGKDKKTKK